MLSSNPSVSVIIPTTRPQAYLKDILALKSQKASFLEFIIIIDNPSDQIAVNIQKIRDEFVNESQIHILQNHSNLGAPASRNRGLKEANGDLIIFLDDDVIPHRKLIDAFIEALENKSYIGALGVTHIPFNDKIVLEHAIDKVGFAYAYSMAEHYKDHSWGPTCNLVIIKKKQTELFFDPIFPKAGGGEDVDFCWRLSDGGKQRFICVSDAMTEHPPWKGYRNNIRRFYRWGVADVPLNSRHPKRRFRDFPNFIEYFFLIFLILVGFCFLQGSLVPIFFLFLALPISFICVSLSEAYNLRTDPITAMMGLLLVISHDLGRFMGLIIWKKPQQFLARTLYFDSDYPWRTRKRSIRNLIALVSASLMSLIIWQSFLF